MQQADLISKIDRLKSEIDALRPIKPEQERLIMDKFRLDWNYHSNAIEGNRLTYGETKAFLLEGMTAQGKPFKDHLDIKGHNEVIIFLESLVQKKEVLSEAMIRELHKALLREPYKVEAKTTDGRIIQKWVKLGAYKTEPNFIQTSTGELRGVVSPLDTPAKMHELLEWFRKETALASNHPVIIASIFHHAFTHIHPFDDGNGRMARILMNLILMQHGLLPVIIKAERKEEYIAALIKADAGEQNELVNLIANYEIDSEELYLKGASGKDISDFNDIDKKIALLKQELNHIEEPSELTPTVQKELFSRSLKLILSRLIKKLGQVDDFYSNSRLFILGSHSRVGAPAGTLQLNANASGKDKEALLNSLGEAIDNASLFSQLNFQFYWENFKRDGKNTFHDQLALTVNFEKFKYSIVANYGGSHIFDEEYVYQITPSEDDIMRLVNKSAECCYNHIKRQIEKKVKT